MRRFTKESVLPEESQSRRTSPPGGDVPQRRASTMEPPGDVPHRRASMDSGAYRRGSKEGSAPLRRGSKEAGQQLRRAGRLSVQGRLSQQENVAPPVVVNKEAEAAAAAAAAAEAEAARETRERQELARFSREIGMPLDMVKDAAEVFREHVPDCGTGDLGKATMPMITLGDLFGQKIDEHDEAKQVDFKSFATSFFCRGFSEGCMLTAEQRELRQLARKHDMEHANIDKYKRYFDDFDNDGNGSIDAAEFKTLLHRLNKMPEGYTLPDSRVSQLWAEADTDKNGSVDFEEFVRFYRKYYERERGEKCPFTRFYCTARIDRT